MDTKTLIFALRCCAMEDENRQGCDACPLEYGGDECEKLCATAADVIEAAERQKEREHNNEQ